MKSFFASLFYAAVIGGIGASLVGKAYQKHLRGFTALLCVALLASPLLKLLPDMKLPLPEEPELSADAGAVAESLVIRQSAADAESALSRCIFSETGIKPTLVHIDIESRGEELYFAKVRVKTKTQSEADTVRKLLQRLFKGSVPAEVTSDTDETGGAEVTGENKRAY